MTTVELMEDQVRAIRSALAGTGMEPPQETTPGTEGAELTVDTVARRFADLNAMVRTIPFVAEKVPPFSFSPPIDVIEDAHEVVVELAVPGVRPEDVRAETVGSNLVVLGVRPGERVANGRRYAHTEIPRGPFRRVVPLAGPIEGEIRIETDSGLIRIHLKKAEQAPSPS